MINKRHNSKVFNLITVLFLAALFLTACQGFSFQAQAAPAEGGGVGVSGGVAPVLPGGAATNPGTTSQLIYPTTIILLLAGFAVLVVILLLLVRRPSTASADNTPRIS